MENCDVWRYVERLPERQRRVVILYAHGLTQEEIGNHLGISQQAVSKLVRHGIESMKKVVKVGLSCP